MGRIMRSTKLLGHLIVAVLGFSMLSLQPASAAPDPRRDYPRMPRECATPAEKVPQDALICELTKFRKHWPTVFLWGDSHAWMEIPALRKAVRGEKVNLVSSMMGSCPPMHPGLRYKDRYQLGRCAASADLAMRYVRKMQRGREDFKVILAANWDMYERALRLIAKGKKPGRGHAEYAFAQAKIFKKGGPRMVRTLARMRVDVDVVGQVARPPRKPAACRKGMDPYQCNFPRRKAFRNEAGTIRWLGRLMAPVARQGIRYIDLNDYICNKRTCFGKVKRVHTFHDNSHITASMSRRMARYFLPSVADVVPGMSAPAPTGGDTAAEPPAPCLLPVLCR